MALSWLLAKITLAEPSLPKVLEPASSDLQPLLDQADNLARHSANWSPTTDSMMSISRALLESDSEFVASKERTKEALLYRAERITFALDRLSVALNLQPKVEKELGALREDVRRRYDFDAVAFVQHLRAFQKALAK
jgi:hypothetical protein